MSDRSRASAILVVAHPDDEVLGAGATAALLASKGLSVTACILSGDVKVRANRPEDAELRSNTLEAQRLLGVQDPILGDFPNIEFNTVPHLRLVAFIEDAMRQTDATIIFTHHPDDLNEDHRQTSRACQAAARLFQRVPAFPPLQGLYFMEILSSTDWSMSGSSDAFRPNAYMEVGRALIERKIEALGAYTGVMRPYPHPRSPEVLFGLAAYRGGQAGMRYAEAFQTVFQDLSSVT